MKVCRFNNLPIPRAVVEPPCGDVEPPSASSCAYFTILNPLSKYSSSAIAAREEFSALHEKISPLEVVAKNFEKNNVSGEMTDLELQIKEVENIVEQTIQLRVTEVVLANDENLRENAHDRVSDSLQQVAEDKSGKSQQRFKIKANMHQRNQQFKSFQARQEIF
ncbi:hypothetical protein BC332_24521 [Capsicum chinense]|nr:hypothetical protein BC332_24521 [Capsicum chinense]